jgi:hypothetical protein
MGFGASLVFFAIGAILAFAVKWDVPGIDLQMIGWIFMAVGVVGGVLTLMYTRKPRVDTIEVVEPDIMFTNDTMPEAEPHVHVHRETVEEETRPHLHRENHPQQTRRVYRDGPA